MAGAPRWRALPVDPDDLSLAGSDARRAALSALSGRRVITVADLATAVAARRLGVDPGTVTVEEREEYRIALEHVHLPRLVEGGVVSVDRGHSIVEPRSSPLFDEPLASLVESEVPTPVVAALGNERRLRVLKILSELGTELPLSDLAGSLVAASRDCALSAVSERERRRCRIDLHHSHVPRLVEVGLIERSHDGIAVRATDSVPELIRRILELGDRFVRSAKPA